MENDQNEKCNPQETTSSNISHQMHNKKDKEKTKTVPFYKLFAFADHFDIFTMMMGTIGAVGNGLAFPIMTILFGDLINAFGQNKDNTQVVGIVSKVALKFVYLGVGTFAGAFLQVTGWMISGERQAARIRGLYLKSILKQDITFFDVETNIGEVIGRMSGDTVLIQEALGEKVGKFIQLISTFIGGFIIAFIKGWLLALVMLSMIPLLVIVSTTIAIIVSKMASEGQASYAKAANVVEQTLGAIRTVASFTGEKQVVNKYNTLLIDGYKSGVKEGLAVGLGLGTLFLVIFCSYALAAWFGGKMILEKGYTGGEVLNVIIAILNSSMSLGQVSPCVSAFAAGQAAAYTMFQTITRKPELDVSNLKGKVFEDIHGDIELKDVYFTYPARVDEPVFQGFSLTIMSGTMTALVGQSGSGKSTVISLIERFYDPEVGEVLIDGINLKEFQLKWIRSKIGLVSQEPVLFTSTIKENITYGKEDATDEEIRVVCKLANASKFIDKLPQGLNTMVGEHGTQLSGGQKQRIAVARAILKDPKILLLDEATSALDTESERIVQEALDRIMVNRTTIVVTHRLSTIRDSDLIVVIQHGKIIEKGSHLDLMKDPEGAYSELIRLQEVDEECGQIGDETKKSEVPIDSFKELSIGQSVEQSLSRRSSSRHSSWQSFRVIEIQSISSPKTNLDQEELPPLEDQSSEVSIRRLAALNKPEIPVLLLGSIIAIINGMILPLFGILFSRVIKSFYEPPKELKDNLRFWAIIFVTFGVATFLFYPCQTYLFSIAGCKLVKRVRSLCFEKLVHMEMGWFDEPGHSSGAIGSRLCTDAVAVRGLVGDALAQMVQNLSSVVTGLVIAFTSSWELALIILAIMPLLAMNGYFQVKFLKGFSADAKMMYEEANQIANDAVGSIRTVASFCAEEKVMKIYEKKCEVPVQAGIRKGLISGISFGLSFFVLFSSYAISFYAGARLVEGKKATFDDVFQVFFALTMATVAISQSSSISPDSIKAKSVTTSVFAILDRESKIDPSNDSGRILQDVRGDIKLHHVSFKYPSRPDVKIFQDLSLKIHAGKTIAFVGESGSGKSTVISLLQRFYDVDSGHITLDGVDIKSLQLKWLRLQMGLVNQEPILFNDTIRANIAYGKGGNAMEVEVVAATKLSNAHNFISGLHQGYDTIVGERGTQLSGGQKQRLAIARAIIKKPRVLLLDEATSALDAESERVVQDALDQVMVNRTTIVVAHRLSTIKNADLIVVVKDGVIAEKGSHETLIKIENGIYASWVQLHTSIGT